MLKVGFKQMLAEASAVVESISAAKAVGLSGAGETVFVDVRENHERGQGFIPDSVHAPRGFLEFIADPEGPMHNPVFTVDSHFVLYCGTGGRSMLAAKTLRDMGFSNVCSLTGGFPAWREAGGEVDG